MKHALVFLLRRAVAGFFTIVVTITLAFTVFWATPTQPARFVYASPTLSNYQIQHGNHLLGADKPKLEQWAHYVTHLLRGDFGTAWEGARVAAGNTKATEYPLAPFVDPALRETLSLLLGGAALVLLLAVPLGTFAGSRIGSLGDRTVSLVALIGICTHPMVIGILVRSLFAGRVHWLPPSGYCPLIRSPQGGCGGPVDWASHLALPWLTFALLFLALYVRMVRTSVAETMHSDYVRTARAKGATEVRVLGRHVLPNAALRVLTMIGMEIGTAIGVSIYIEATFGLHGLASAAVFAMAGNGGALDLPFILALVFLISAIVVVGNLVVDAFFVFFDPRGVLRSDRAPTAKAAAGGVI
jgi:peptide/nickel transport system permease protein